MRSASLWISRTLPPWLMAIAATMVEAEAHSRIVAGERAKRLKITSQLSRGMGLPVFFHHHDKLRGPGPRPQSDKSIRRACAEARSSAGWQRRSAQPAEERASAHAA